MPVSNRFLDARHNELDGLQGGDTDDYQHLTEEEITPLLFLLENYDELVALLEEPEEAEEEEEATA